MEGNKTDEHSVKLTEQKREKNKLIKLEVKIKKSQQISKKLENPKNKL